MPFQLWSGMSCAALSEKETDTHAEVQMLIMKLTTQIGELYHEQLCIPLRSVHHKDYCEHLDVTPCYENLLAQNLLSVSALLGRSQDLQSERSTELAC